MEAMTYKHRLGIGLLLLLTVFMSFQNTVVYGLSAAQKALIESGVHDYNIEEPDCSAVGTPTIPGGQQAATSAPPKSIYMLGDSITNGAIAKYKKAFDAAGISSYVNASGGRSWTGGGIAGAVTPEGSLKPGKDAVIDDKQKIKEAGGIIIALGTNGGEANNPISEIIDTFRSADYNPTAPIWWVNTATVKGLEALGPFNKKLDEQATAQNFNVISWAKTVNPAGDPYVMPTDNAAGFIAGGDNVHPSGAGQDALVKQVVDTIAAGVKPSIQVSGNTCKCEAPGIAGSPTLKGGTNPEIMFNYYVDLGLSPAQAAGITGNAMAESGANIDPRIRSPAGYTGIFQWDKSSRWPRLVSWAKEKGKDEYALETQMEFAWLEATERGIDQEMKNQNTVELATWYWGRFFEIAIINGSKSKEPLTNVQILDKRTNFARDVLASFGGNTPSTISATESSGDTGAKTVVALDPGHGAAIPDYTDPITGLKDRETANSPEREDVQDVANRIKTSLEKDGYSVILLKDTADGSINKRERVNKAISANANLVVSLHTTPGEQNEVWPQRVGKFRENNDDKKRVTFENEETAVASDKFAKAIAEERTKTQGKPVDTDEDQSSQKAAFSAERDGLNASGDISLVQLWSTDIPWVYNEIGQDGPGNSITEQTKQAYADGVVNGIKKSLPVSAGSNTTNCVDSTSVGSGDLAATIKAYAWPDQRNTGDANAREMMPAYKEAVAKSTAEGIYNGGTTYDGIDCGGFVTLALLNSGYEPNYNFAGKGGPTGTQLDWVRKNWQKLGRGNEINTGTLQLGDVAFRVTSSGGNAGHTFVYVGQLDGFNGIVASAGLNNRAPSANGGYDDKNVTKSSYEWYRKK